MSSISNPEIGMKPIVSDDHIVWLDTKTGKRISVFLDETPVIVDAIKEEEDDLDAWSFD
tara:strand:+ start:209 stop:385 length:177 start_codon:yes stop_codon:yes gene_type:complete